MHFAAIDVETANSDLGSLCQVGVAHFTDGVLTEEWSTLLDPEDYFDGMNVSIHGITPEIVEGKPTFPQIADRLRSAMERTTCVSHTHFDRVAIARAFARYGLAPISASWLDSARVARRFWKDLAWHGYGLANCCAKIGYTFQHHDALEDAKAAGMVLLAVLRESRQDLEAWKARIRQPIDPERSSSGAAIERVGNPEGDLYGEVIVFTGALDIPRVEAADLAASIGCTVDQNVTRRTTILVVGDQDARRLAGHELSSKQRKAQQLASAGVPIRLIRESDFRALVRGVCGEV
jgi:DNA polymerase-3 subunit epsilon